MMKHCAILLALLLPRLLSGQTEAGRAIILATTTSVRDAGLLDEILPPFMIATGYEVRTIAVGSGHAMELGRRGEADILILHDPVGEQRFMADGHGETRTPLMHNYFVVAGPRSDPAGVRDFPDAASAFRRIADRGARFLSRGDNSGTHVKELQIWSAAQREPRGDWLWESGQGMSATIQIAAEVEAYVLSDIGTFLRHPANAHLAIMVAGGELLQNPYHVVLVRTGERSWRNAAGARALLDYLVSPPTQDAIAAFGLAEYGQSVFVPDAATESRP